MKKLLCEMQAAPSFSAETVAALIEALCDETVAPEQKAFALGLVTARGVDGAFLAAAASTLMAAATKLDLADGQCVDVCGTGGDTGPHQIKTFNISTAVAFVLAAGGVPVAKHGNRAVSSQSGSSDVLGALRIPLCLTPADAKACFAKHNLCFLSAPHFHPVLKNLATLRRSLGVPTFLNLLGPLMNPAKTSRQLIGVYDAKMAAAMIEAARLLGKTEVMLVHADDGLDEISLCGPTHIYHLKDGAVTEKTFVPEDLGIACALPEQIAGGSALENAARIESVFAGEQGPCATIVAVNAAAAFVAAGVVPTMEEGLMKAHALLADGAVLQKLREMRAAL